MKKMVCDNSGTSSMLICFPVFLWVITVIVNYVMPYSDKEAFRWAFSILEIAVLMVMIPIWYSILFWMSPQENQLADGLVGVAFLDSIISYLIFHMSIYQLVKYVKMRMWNNVKSHFVYLSYENRNHWI